MYPIQRLDVVTLERFKPDMKKRSNALVFPGELFPGNLGLLPHQGIAAATQFSMDSTDSERPRLVCDIAVKTYMVGHKLQELPGFIKDNAKDMVLLVNKRGYFLMERVSALEIEKSFSIG